MKIFIQQKLLSVIVILTTINLYASQTSIDPSEVPVDISKNYLEEIFKEIEQQTPLTFAYNEHTITNKKVAIQKGKQNLETCLNSLATQLSLEFKFMGNQVYVSLIKNKEKSKQKTEITGKVTDEQNIPLPGATIREKGTLNGTSTDFEGNFNLQVSNPEAILEISYIGYEKQEVSIKNKDSLEIILLADLNGLEEVLIVGYGTQKKANLTGAVSQITSKELENRPITNISSGLQGLMPGVTVTGAMGTPGNNTGSIRIRGIGTWGNATPLVVIDGVPGGNLNILNPSDIENISVLKDAASSSIYGVRGANGVILVTTKKGKSGEPTLTYDYYYGFQKPTALPKPLGSPEYMALQNEAQENVGRNPTYSDEDIAIAKAGTDLNNYANTNWINEVYKNYAPQQNHNLSLNGGNKNTNYYMSYGFLDEGGLIIGDNYSAKRHNVRLKLNTTVFDKLDINSNIGYIDRNVIGSSAGTSPLAMALSMTPLAPVKNTAGGWGYIGGSSNPVAVASAAGTNDFTSEEFTGNIEAILHLSNYLKLKARYGLVKYNSRRNIFEKTINYYHAETGDLLWQNGFPNKITSSSYKGTYQTFIGTAEYDRTFLKAHSLKALIGASQEENISDDIRASRTNVVSSSTGNINLGTENQLNGGSNKENALRSIFGRLNYAYKDKYLAEVNFRYDGSSRFSSDVRWDLFSSASLGWVFTKEKIFNNLDFLNFGKFRASYGVQGNDRIADLAYLDILGPVGTMPIGDEPTFGYRQTSVGNKLLTWETAEKTNLGLDLAFLDNRLNISGDYFSNKTENILLKLPIPDVFGGPSYPYQNAGAVENKGWELQIGWKDHINDFNYSLNFNLSDVKNKVTNLGGTEPTIDDRIRMKGEPLDAFYGLVADRIAQKSDFTYDEASGVYTPNFPTIQGDPVQPGDLIYKDLNGDGEVDLINDRKVIGSHIPRYTYGFSAAMNYKGIDFSFMLQGVAKVSGLITGNARHAFINNSAMPQDIHLDRWTPENTNASYPRLTYLQSYNQRLSTLWLEDASYFRLKNIQLGYTLPKTITKKFRINKLRAYVSADNLITVSNFFKGYDPESPVSGGGFYPQLKTIVVGVNIKLQ